MSKAFSQNPSTNTHSDTPTEQFYLEQRWKPSVPTTCTYFCLLQINSRPHTGPKILFDKYKSHYHATTGSREICSLGSSTFWPHLHPPRSRIPIAGLLTFARYKNNIILRDINNAPFPPPPKQPSIGINSAHWEGRKGEFYMSSFSILFYSFLSLLHTAVE